MAKNFFSIYSHGFIRTAVAVPKIRLSNPQFNLERTLVLAAAAGKNHSALVLFPELGISGYSNEDLFQQDALQKAVLSALEKLRFESRKLSPAIIVGAPLRFQGMLFNCGIVVYQGKILGIAPKTYIPNYREFYEKRHFCSANAAIFSSVDLFGETIPFGNDLVFENHGEPRFAFGIEICEDVWAPIPPSTYQALSGATVLGNLSASNITIGKADYRQKLAASHSGRCLSAYLYSAAGSGESTTDLAWDGHGMIWENGKMLSETLRFSDKEELVFADIDVERLLQERSRVTSFSDAVKEYSERIRKIRKIPFAFNPPFEKIPLQRPVERFPFVPVSLAARDERCQEAYNIQVQGLAQRLTSSGIKKVVIGVSGGLDSTQALIVAVHTMERLSLPRKNVLAYTMPGFATSSRTFENAKKLMKVLGVTSAKIDIKSACMALLKNIGHPFAKGKKVYDITFENVQAGERTSHLFRIANLHNALVLGTGDLSELALGWCTYGVGDHMSHYNVNSSVPKTLVQYLIRWVISSNQFGNEANKILRSIVETEISPELVPADETMQNTPFQSTESVIGPYQLQDFHLYYITRFGFAPSKVAFLCHHAWHDRTKGLWPEDFPQKQRREFSLAEIKKWLKIFLSRFFGNTQFKRSCVPNGPKVGSGGSLSPRGDWRAPSDSEATAWLQELEDNVPDY